MGFIDYLQGIKFNERRFEPSCWKIVKHVGRIESISDSIIRSLIKEFGETCSYDEACENAKKILFEFEFTPTQAKRIMRHTDRKDQIYESKTARPHILEFIKKYEEHLDDGMIEDYKRRSRRWL